MSKVQNLDEVAGSWNWNGSMSQETVRVGQYGVGNSSWPIMATISRSERKDRWVKWRYELTINYNGNGNKKVISKNIEVARPAEEVEEMIKESYSDEFEEEEITEKVNDIIEAQKLQIEDGELIQGAETAENKFKDFVEDGEWYEQLSDLDKMEVA